MAGAHSRKTKPIKANLVVLPPSVEIPGVKTRAGAIGCKLFLARQLAGAARELLQSQGDSDTMGLQVCRGVCVKSKWGITVPIVQSFLSYIEP